MYDINIYAIFFHDRFQIWASQYSILEEETKQSLDVAGTHLTTFMFYHFVEKSGRNDLELFIDFPPLAFNSMDRNWL